MVLQFVGDTEKKALLSKAFFIYSQKEHDLHSLAKVSGRFNAGAGVGARAGRERERETETETETETEKGITVLSSCNRIGSLTNHCCPGKTRRAQLVNEPMGQFANEQQTPNYKQQTEFQQ